MNSNEENFFSVFLREFNRNVTRSHKKTSACLCVKAPRKIFLPLSSSSGEKKKENEFDHDTQKKSTSFIYRSTEGDNTNGRTISGGYSVTGTANLVMTTDALQVLLKRGKRCSRRRKCTRVDFFLLIERPPTPKNREREKQTSLSKPSFVFFVCAPIPVLVRLKKNTNTRTRRQQQHQRRQRDVLPSSSRGRSSGVDDWEDFTYSSSSFSSFIFFFFTIIIIVSYVFLAFGIHRGKRTRPMECLRGKKLIFFFCRDARTQRGNRRRRRKARSSMDDEQRFETRVTTTVQSSSLQQQQQQQ